MYSRVLVASFVVLAAGSGCTDGDKQVWNADAGHSKWQGQMTSCGMKCLGRQSCMTSCMQGDGWSSGCAGCFGALAQCTASHCLVKCMGGRSPGCVTCLKSAGCDTAAFGAGSCTGFVEPSMTVKAVATQCTDADKQYEERQKVRSEEIKAVSETIGILTDDEAQTAFSKSSSFIQLSLRTRRVSKAELNRQRAARLLKQTAMKTGSSQLAKIASSMENDPFAKVKESIDAMMAELKKIQAEEADQYEFCTSEIKANEKETAAKTETKADLEQKKEDLESAIATLKEEIATLKAYVAQTNVEMKTASENREAENADFQVTVADQKATQAILKKALDRLKAFYAAKGLLQTKADQTPPPQMKYKKSGGATGVMYMIEAIVKESVDVEKKALYEENQAQKAYEEFIAESNASVAAASENIASKSEASAKAEKDKIATEEDLAATIQNLLMLGEHNVALHQDCDFLIKNFDIRQSARSEEIESLFNAKAIFSGANFGFLQQHKF